MKKSAHNLKWIGYSPSTKSPTTTGRRRILLLLRRLRRRSPTTLPQ
uniref:Uncharacterized protein MANES_09G153300 n=1 Tax=Rhizophora mucronata TaxID=61149 RepID=A0A2P2MSC2_RHIMU